MIDFEIAFELATAISVIWEDHAMNLKAKDNVTLVKDLKFFISEERRILNLVLHHLREVEVRKLHLEMGYTNLYTFCTRELGYSEASAHRRISAMRLIREIPEVEEKIQKGLLSLSVISQAQSFFRKKKEEHHRVSSNGVTLNRQALAKLSHRNPTASEIFEMGFDLLLKKHDPPLPPIGSEAEPTHGRVTAMRAERSRSSTTSRYIPAAFKQEVTRRSQGRCQYQDPVTGRSCGSEFYLEIDHIKPLAHGGRTELQNLRLLCSNHNKFVWEQVQKRTVI